ncbi:MAG: hypothetical protein EOO38_03480 [Cytophagaceae bacterium]|nr:MAG: hypothetical protein EOO38_03480 [Cytophagaceae bacterium]
MKISDKELDNIFHSKLNDLEVEPNEMVWNNISDQLNNKVKKKSIVPILRIAASVIVVVSVGLLLLQKNGETVKKPVRNKVVKVEIKQQKTVSEPIESTKLNESMLLLSVKNKPVKDVHQNKISNKKRVLISVPKANSELKVTDEMLVSNNQPEKKNEPTAIVQTAAKTTIVPDASTRFSIKAEDEETIAATTKSKLLAVKNSTPTVVAKRKGIRSIGDVVNLVMAKVDKRQDKLIEFSDSDDGEEDVLEGELHAAVPFIRFQKSEVNAGSMCCRNSGNRG